ncbi:MAG: hypothetical protein QW607_01895 [Desulfurococcaceae archaeon]
MWTEFVTLVLTVTVFHELGHLLTCLRRVRGMFIGISKRLKGPVIGFVVHPLSLLDIMFPQVLVPLILFLIFHGNLPIMIVGILSNVGGGIWDFLLIKKLKELNEKDPNELMERTREDLIGIFVEVHR